MAKMNIAWFDTKSVSFQFFLIFFATCILLNAQNQRIFAQTSLGDEEQAYYQSKHYIPIKGEQDSDYPRGVYLVTDNVEVPKGKTMTFMPGTLVLFKKDTKITVNGRLICQGNPKGTITFGKLSNDKYFIPLDSSVDARWDGIFVTDSGSAEISFSYITGSKYGLETDTVNHGRVMLDTVMFRNNKFQNLKVAGNVINVPENQFVFYSTQEDSPFKIGKNKQGNGKITLGHNQSQRWKLPVQIGLGALGLIGGAVYVTERIAAADYQKKSDNSNVPNDVVNNYNKGQDAATISNYSLLLGIIGALGFTVTFFF